MKFFYNHEYNKLIGVDFTKNTAVEFFGIETLNVNRKKIRSPWQHIEEEKPAKPAGGG